ncbi:MarR family winged helix-turn-helix transcriptional regulator [Amaricoccus solimangrovi]|uniref:MarR family transcriptional regulator n=1 Tax=Amaricoccus solimangrovi TaxID=2589815 RepID=A0A501WQV2_9RHOB|nr:MarR family transcriptional regulator [Amaricoccus solimangrovi]TPE51738.1 MarR family transcriptional regulator [Amaricoccus solimangrovi]
MKPDPTPSEFLETLTKVSRKIRTAFDQRVTEQGLTYPRARVLFRLIRKQNVTQRELACELELEQATLVRLLDRMAENGLIERRPDPGDRRAKLVALTDHGREQAEVVSAIAGRMREEIFRGFDPDELRSALGVLERLWANLAEPEVADVSA